jgi:hypothetical protein
MQFKSFYSEIQDTQGEVHHKAVTVQQLGWPHTFPCGTHTNILISITVKLTARVNLLQINALVLLFLVDKSISPSTSSPTGTLWIPSTDSDFETAALFSVCRKCIDNFVLSRWDSEVALTFKIVAQRWLTSHSTSAPMASELPRQGGLVYLLTSLNLLNKQTNHYLYHLANLNFRKVNFLVLDFGLGKFFKLACI